MALRDFLGNTPEIRIFDFLVENRDNSYDISEISRFTGTSRRITSIRVSLLHSNNIIDKVGLGKYHISDNDIVNKLIEASLAHSFKQAETD